MKRLPVHAQLPITGNGFSAERNSNRIGESMMTAPLGQEFQEANDWKETTLGDLASAADCLIQTGPFGSQLHKYEYQEHGVGVVNPTHLSKNRIDHSNVPCVSSDTANRLERHRLMAGDILLGRRGEIGRHGLVTEAEDGWLCGTGCFLVRIRREDVDNHFLCLVLTTKDTVDWLNRHAAGVVMPNLSNSVLHRVPISLPSISEQRKIAGLLALVQRGIEQQERLIALTRELKKALLRQLFTEGLRGDPQKQTEVGPVPQSWEVGTLEDVAFAFDYGTSVKCEHGKAGVPVLRIPNVVGGSIDLSDLKHGQPKPSELEHLRLQDGDLLFVRTNGVLENAGRCALYRGELAGCYFASYLMRVRVDSTKVLPAFVNEYARTERGRSFLSGRAIRTADGKFNINSGTLKRVMLPLPSVAEQAEIVDELNLAERKLSLHERKHAALTALFRTLLHQLMTAQIRVHDLDRPNFSSSQGARSDQIL